MSIILQDFIRPPAELVAALSRIPTPILSDALGRMGGMDAGIRPLDHKMQMGGVAYTVKTYPADNLMCHLALKLAHPGDIIVVDAGGLLTAALWGDLMSLNAKKRDLGGLVIDGAVRDQLDICELGFPVFARGCCPAGTFKSNLGSLNTPISCGGVSVSPGDVVVGDSVGVVVVPAQSIDKVLVKAQEVIMNEDGLRDRITSDTSIFDLLNLEEVLKSKGIELD